MILKIVVILIIIFILLLQTTFHLQLSLFKTSVFEMSQSINNVQTIYCDCNTFLFSNMGGYQVFQCDTPIIIRGLQLCVCVCVCV